jgi:hypothetical protein
MTSRPTPADWLLAQYDSTDIDELFDIRPPHVQPMFTLKSASDPGDPMRIQPSDYHDPGRWWP